MKGEKEEHLAPYPYPEQLKGCDLRSHEHDTFRDFAKCLQSKPVYSAQIGLTRRLHIRLALHVMLVDSKFL